MKIDILDCTLRDGGYQNAWDFAEPLVARYLRALDRTGCSYVEMGYRARATDRVAGRYRYTPDHLVQRHCEGLRLKPAVMIDAKSMCGSDGLPDLPRLASLFGRREDSSVHLVRIAATVEMAPAVSAISRWLKAQGYEVAVNLMQASTVDAASIRAAALTLNDSGADFVYLADSFGGLTPDDALLKVGALAASFRGRIGFHAHDNMGLAFANTLVAIAAGATIVDGSVLGMGRGAGNLRTEQLLAYLEKTGAAFAAAPLLDTITTDFAPLQTQLGWGPTAPYLVTGVSDIHPTYAQMLLREPNVDDAEAVRVLATLASHPARGAYSEPVLRVAIANGARQRVVG